MNIQEITAISLIFQKSLTHYFLFSGIRCIKKLYIHNVRIKFCIKITLFQASIITCPYEYSIRWRNN